MSGKRYRERHEIMRARSHLSYPWKPPPYPLELGAPFTPDAAPPKRKRKKRKPKPRIVKGFCFWCTVDLEREGVRKTKDHYIPRSWPESKGLGQSNLVPACYECNHQRGDIGPVAWRECVEAVMRLGVRWPDVGREAKAEWRRRRIGTSVDDSEEESA